MSRFMAECQHCGELFDNEDAWFEHGRLQAEKKGCKQTPQQRIDDALDRVLRASGSRLANYTMPSTLKAMRNEMRAIMGESYIAWSNACHRAANGVKR